MKIKHIISQHRRDFEAVYVCEYCGYEMKGEGYDDNVFHNTVLPKIKCTLCKKSNHPEYVPRIPKYKDDIQL
jgi:primosomal protein N'